MSYFISLTAIFMAVFAFKYITRKKVELLFPVVTLGIVFSLYIFGLCKILFVGGFIILFASLSMFCYSVFKIIKYKDKNFVKEFFSPLIVVLLAFFVFQFIALFKMQVVSWDELTHWGLVVKNMFYHRNFGGGLESTTMFKGYPVGSSLFLYFFEMFGFNFAPANLYMAMNLLNISLLLPIASKFNNNKQKLLIVFSLIGISLIFNYKMLISVWNDVFLSLAFAYVLISYFCFIKTEGLGKINVVSLMLGLFGLISSKSTGLILAIFACFIIGLDLIFNRREVIKENKKKTIIAVVLIIISISLPKITWTLYLKTIDVGGAWQTSNLTIKNIFNYFMKPTFFQKEVTKNFILACFWPFKNRGNAGSLKIPLIVEIALIFGLIIYIKKKCKESKNVRPLIFGVFISLFAYLIGILISYLFTFSETEAIKLASFVRYINTFVMGIVIFLVAYIISFIKPKEKSKTDSKFLILVFSSILIIALICCPIVGVVMENKTKEYEIFTMKVKAFDKNDKIYIIDTTNSFKNYLTLRFIATPIDASGLKIGGSPHIGDVWDSSMPANEVVEYVVDSGYNILYLHNVNNDFALNYTNYFQSKPKEKTFYHIVIEDQVVLFEEFK